MTFDENKIALRFLRFIGVDVKRKRIELDRMIMLLMLLFCLGYAIGSEAQIDDKASKDLAKQINRFRTRNFKKTLKYNPEYQLVCDSLVKTLPGNPHHSKFSRYQVGEVYVAYTKDVDSWRLSPNHRQILLSPYAKEICVSVFKDANGKYWSLGRTYAIDRKNPPPHR